MKTSLGYSAAVRMHLIAGSHILTVAQAGPDFLILEQPCALNPTRGELVVDIDGIEERSFVFLPDGIRVTDERTRIALA